MEWAKDVFGERLQGDYRVFSRSRCNLHREFLCHSILLPVFFYQFVFTREPPWRVVAGGEVTSDVVQHFRGTSGDAWAISYRGGFVVPVFRFSHFLTRGGVLHCLCPLQDVQEGHYQCKHGEDGDYFVVLRLFTTLPCVRCGGGGTPRRGRPPGRERPTGWVKVKRRSVHL